MREHIWMNIKNAKRVRMNVKCVRVKINVQNAKMNTIYWMINVFLNVKLVNISKITHVCNVINRVKIVMAQMNLIVLVVWMENFTIMKKKLVNHVIKIVNNVIN